MNPKAGGLYIFIRDGFGTLTRSVRLDALLRDQ